MTPLSGMDKKSFTKRFHLLTGTGRSSYKLLKQGNTKGGTRNNSKRKQLRKSKKKTAITKEEEATITTLTEEDRTKTLKNGNVLEPGQSDNFNAVDDQRQLLTIGDNHRV